MTLHWWRTDRLVNQLENNALSQSDAAKYMMISAVLWAQSNYFSLWFGGFRSWALIIEFAMVLIISLVGVRECYKSNGASQGKDFILRFCAISVPIGIKLAIVGFVVGQSFYWTFPYVITNLTFRDPAFIYQFFGFTSSLTFAIIYYWRIAFHLAILGQRSSPNAPLMGSDV